VRALAWSAFKRRLEVVEQGPNSRYEEAENASEEDVPETAVHGKSNHESNRAMPNWVPGLHLGCDGIRFTESRTHGYSNDVGLLDLVAD
jgi:hypothetical protein